MVNVVNYIKEPQVNVEQFATRMLELMPRMMKGAARYENNYLTSGKITIPQFWVLGHLYRHGESTMTSVAEMIGASKPAATGIIDRLIAQGFVQRRHDKKDRRIVGITITSKGKKIIGDIFRQRHRTMVNIFGAIPAADRIKYLQILEQVVKILDTPVKASKD